MIKKWKLKHFQKDLEEYEASFFKENKSNYIEKIDDNFKVGTTFENGGILLIELVTAEDKKEFKIKFFFLNFLIFLKCKNSFLLRNISKKNQIAHL